MAMAVPVLSAAWPGAVPATDLPGGLTHYGRARFLRQRASNSLQLDDGAVVKLIGLHLPDAVAVDWTSVVSDTELVYGGGGRQYDRYGRVLAHVYTDQGMWLQGLALSRGWAQIKTFADNRAMVAEMRTHEAEARLARRGLWRWPGYGIYRHDDIDGLLKGPGVARDGKRQDGFRIVAGRIVKVARGGRNLYFNFGTDFRRDFTLVAEPKARRLFMRENFQPKLLQGRRVRVRGWVRYWNGPAMMLTHPEQIEVLD